MSIGNEIKKAGQKITNYGEDKNERAADCFNTVKAAKGDICKANTKEVVTSVDFGIERIEIGEGQKLDYCLDQLKQHLLVPCSEVPTELQVV